MYSLKKSNRILHEQFHNFKRKSKRLTPSQKQLFETKLKTLEEAIQSGQREQADQLAREAEALTKQLLPKKAWDYTQELVYAIVFALVVATLVRTMWFELYRIPTGSMRPTFEEQDSLIVSKTPFGINIPLLSKHFYFDPSLVKRTGIVIFSIDNMDIANPYTTYFYLFPGTKLLVKRLIGKPGDTLYFYGGKIYGIDKQGNDLAELREAPWLEKIDHVPYISFEGKVKPVSSDNKLSRTEYYFYQMNQPIAKISLKARGDLKSSVYNGTNWVPDQPDLSTKPHNKIVTYSDIWGMGNYAMARLLNKDQLKQFAADSSAKLEDAPLYLELFHSPNLTYPALRLARDDRGQIIPLLTPMTSFIPLKEENIEALWKNLYTARFVVQNGQATRYNETGNYQGFPWIPLSGVPDGTYEFYYGIGYSVNTFGMRSPLAKDHPLYRHDPQNTQTLFNLGIEFNKFFTPQNPIPFLFASRYAYFRDGDLYLMGGPVYKKSDPTLISFIEQEQKKQSNSTSLAPYIAFQDKGAPLKDGKIDADFIKAFGIQVPEKMYLVLGDNYAMSGDSREFGFVPEDNLRGGPWFIFWPFSDRTFHPLQPEYPWLGAPQLTIWVIVVVISGITYVYYRRRENQKLF